MPNRFIFAILTFSLLLFPFAVWADLSNQVTLRAIQTLNLDTGATTNSNNGGDIKWDGTNLAIQANATAFNYVISGAVGPTTFAALTQAQISATPASLLTKTPINGAFLAVGDVFVVHTNGGNFAKVLVTANTGPTLGLQYTTYGASGGSGGGGAPALSITAVENAATNIPPGLPNAAVAQGALFVIKGANLGPAAAAIATSFPLPSSIGGTSVQVTVGGTTVDAIMYYSLAAQVAAILPSKTPLGTGTVKVTYNGQSATGPITVVANNIGMFTLSTTGSGDAVATLPATNTVVSPTNAPNPGETVTLWATGLGPVAFDESNAAQQADMTNVPLKVFIGGQAATVLFRGRNACCAGVDTIYVAIPPGLTGCANSVIMQIGNLVSNATTIPVAATGRTCTPINSNSSSGTGTHSFGGFSLDREVIATAGIGTFPGSTTKMDFVGGSFEKVTAPSNPPQGSQIDINSYGSCTVTIATSGQNTPPSTGSVQWLDAGQITVTGPGIGTRPLGKSTTGGTLIYQVTLDNTASTLTAGLYTFTGAGGPDVGPFTATYNMPTPFTWTNQASLATVVRANGATVTWTGGDPAGYVTIAGQSTLAGATAAQTASVGFTCTARVSDGSFTVPPIVLLGLPASATVPGSTTTLPGSLTVTSTSSSASAFQASGIDAGGIGSAFIYGSSAIYQ